MLRATMSIGVGSDGNYIQVWWQNHSGGAVIGDVRRIGANDAGGAAYRHTCTAQTVTGLTPGNVYTLDLWGQTNGGTAGFMVNDCSVEAWGV